MNSLNSLKNLSNRRFFANDLTAWTPQVWAMESLMILEEQLFAPKLVHRDFEPLVASQGDIVKTRRPNEFEANTKTDADDVTFQDLTATNVNVPLDQHLEVSFKIRDEEWSKGMKNMVENHMRPASTALARRADRVIFGAVHQFLANAVGKLGGMTDTNAKDYILYTRERMNTNKVPEDRRNLVLTVGAETNVLRNAIFTEADKRGDTIGLRDASIGHKLNFDTYRSNNAPVVLGTNTIFDGDCAINNAAGYPAGTTVMAVDALGTAFEVGSWVTVDGLPNIVTACTTTQLTVRWPLTRSVADNATVIGWTPAAVNNGSGYAAGYHKIIAIDGTTPALQVGQAVTFGTASPSTTPIYTIVRVSSNTGIYLDRPLEAALVDNQSVNVGPPGNFSFAFHRNAIAFVNRALATPPAGLGANSFVVSSKNGLSMRVTMQYHAIGQFTQVTFDMLCGIKVLDTNLGAVLLS